MKKILFPTDFSFASLNAFRYALHLAHKIDAEIVTLHVYELPTGTYVDYYDFLSENYSITDWDEFANCKSEVPKLTKIAEQEHLTKIPVCHMLSKGRVVDTIVSVAESERADFIVMGTTGASGIQEIFLGSVTDEVMNMAKATVLAIPEHCLFNKIKNLLFLTRFKEYQLPLLIKMHELAQLLHAHIDVLQVKDKHDAQEAEVLKTWKNAVQDTDINFYIIQSNDYEGTVLDFIETNKIDIVTMPVRHKGFFRKLFASSLSRKLNFHSNIPIMGLYHEGSEQ
ncbi:MAG: universal stress protein [Flavobacterium sp.]|nr:MAG: universal stress protein [Flavobacterium sp.]